MLIQNARVLTMEGPALERGCIRIADGKIAAVAETLEPQPGEELLDASGWTVMPGMVDAHCHVGLYNYGLGAEGSGTNEMVTPMTPQLSAIDSINPRNSIMSDSYEAGITTICTGPGSANLIGGTFTVIKTVGDCVDKMIVKKEAALKAAFGENPKRCYGRMLGKEPFTRMGSLGMMRQRFYDAKAYMEACERAERGEGERPERDLGLENMVKVLRGEIPLKCHAHRADDMFSAIRLAKEFGFRITLEHCTEGRKIARQLAKEGYPLIVGPFLTERWKVEMAIDYDSPIALAQEGIEFAFCTDAPVVPQRLLPVIAGYMVSRGLDEQQAFRAITITPARILGVDDRVGSIKPGKDADLVCYDGHPFDMEAKVRRVFVDGATVFHQ